jgi:hypothetical protein
LSKLPSASSHCLRFSGQPRPSLCLLPSLCLCLLCCLRLLLDLLGLGLFLFLDLNVN